MNREADRPGGHWCESIDIALRVHPSSLASLGQLRADLGDWFVPQQFQIDVVNSRLHRFNFLAVRFGCRRLNRSLPKANAAKKSLHRVVVALRDRIKLVIVAASATDAQTQKGFTG